MGGQALRLPSVQPAFQNKGLARRLGRQTVAVDARPIAGPAGEDDVAAVDAGGRKLFSLGRLGIVVNALAVLYGVLMVINLAWPRAEVFDPSGEMPILRWAGPICIVATVLVGIACYPRGKEHPRPVTTSPSA